MLRIVQKSKKSWGIVMAVVMLVTILYPAGFGRLAHAAGAEELVYWSGAGSGSGSTADVPVTRSNAANQDQKITATGSAIANFTTAGPISGITVASATGWTNAPAYWEASVNTTGYVNLLLSSRQLSSNTGPRDFKLQYRLTKTEDWKDVLVDGNPATVLIGSSSWGKGGVDDKAALVNVPLPAEANDQPSLYIRWLVHSTNAVNGTFGASGTSRIAEVYVNGTPKDGAGQPAPDKSANPAAGKIRFGDNFKTVIGDAGAVAKGAAVRLSLDGTSVAGSTYASPADGSFSYELDNPGRAATVYVSALEEGKTESDKVAIAIAKTAPPAASKIVFADPTTVKGAASAVTGGATVIAYLDGVQVATGFAESDGSFLLTIPNPGGRTQVGIAAKEAGKLESNQTTVSMADTSTYLPGDIVISQIYPNAGNSGAFYKTKFFELHNTTDRDITFGGQWSIGYVSAAPTSFSAGVALTGTIKAHGYYLVTGSSGANGADLPVAADQTTSLNPSGSAGGILFVAHKTSAPANDEDPDLIDLVAFGNGTANNGKGFMLDMPHWGNPFIVSNIGSGPALRRTDEGSDPRSAFGLGNGAFWRNPSQQFVMNVPAIPSNPQEVLIRNALYKAAPDRAKIAFAGATVAGTAGAVPASSVVKAYFEDAGTLTPAGQTTAAANGSFTIAVADAGAHTAVYVTHTDVYKESFYTRIDAAPGAGAAMPIGELRKTDANGVPIYFGYETTVEGVATTDNQALGAEKTNFYLQDASGGIQALGGKAPAVAVLKGHKYRLTGRVAFTAGTTQFVPTAIEELAEEASLSPLAVTPDKLSAFASAEPLEGKLVFLKAKVSNIPVDGPDYNVTVTDDAGNTAVVRILAASGIDVAGGAIGLGESFTFTGIVGQSKAASPYTSGYYLLPRNAADVQGQLQFSHTRLDKAYVGADVVVKATAKYADSVTLYFKGESDAGYAPLPLLSADRLNYNAAIPKEQVPPGKLLYYVEAKGVGEIKSEGTAAAPIAIDVVEDRDGPAFGEVLPAENDEIETMHPEISAAYEDPSGVDVSKTTLKLDDKDYTAKAVVTESSVKLTLTPADDLGVGVHTVTVSVQDKLGNPSVKTWTFKVAERFTGGNHYYGTTHNHTNISHDASGNPEDALKAAQYYGYDWFAFSDHSHDIDSSLVGTDTVEHKGMPERTGGSDWQLTKNLASQYTKNGDFVVFPAFEMTSTTWGHSNVFGTDNFIDRKQDGGKYQDLKSYYAWVLTYDNIVAQFNHPGMSANAFDNFIPYDKNVDKLFTMLEVGNGSGKYSYVNVQDKFFNALDLGWHIAPTYGEDNHDATWGQTNKRTVIVSKDLSQESLLEAMRKMRVYFTEDPNAKLDATANGWYMGSTVDSKTLNFDIRFSDDVLEEKTDPKYGYLKTPSDDRVAKAELITNGGTVVDTYVPKSSETSFRWTPTTTVMGGQQWFVVRITQADGDRIYSAPFWSPEVPVAVKISNVAIAEGAVIGGVPATLQAVLSNMGTVDVTNVKAKFYYDDLSHPIGEADIASLKVGQSATASVVWSEPAVGDRMLIVALTADQDLGGYQYQQAVAVKAPLGKTILIDASRNNENTTKDASATYKDKLQMFTTQMRQLGYTVKENASPLSDTVLKGVSVLYISHPATAYGTAEIAAIKTYVDGGGSVWFSEKSNYGSGSNQNLNPILSAIGSRILVNNDGIADETKDGNFWSNPLTSNYAVRLYPQPVRNHLTDLVPTIEYYSGSSLAGNDGAGNKVALQDGGPVTVLAWGNDSTFQISAGQIKADTVQYNVSTSPAPANLTGGAIIPAIASETLAGGGRIVVSGMNIFNDLQLKNDNGNDELARNAMNWLSHLEKPVTPIGQARQLPEGTEVLIQGQVTTAAGVFFDAAYVQDETGGIMAFNDVPEGTLKLGDVVRVYGHIKVFENNTEIEFDKFDNSIVKVSEGTPLAPKAVSTKDSISPAYQGQLVRVTGTVTEMPDSNSIVVDDGSGPVLVFVDGYIANQSGPIPDIRVGDRLSAVGLSGKYAEGDRIRVRDAKELAVLSGQTAEEVAASITAVAPPLPNATALTLPAVPAGFGIAIKSSSDPGVVGTDGKIVLPEQAATVTLVLTVTRLSDVSAADTVPIDVTVPAKLILLTPEVVASGIAGIPAPAKDAAKLSLPEVPEGFEVAIASSSRPEVIALDGTITPPEAETTVQVALVVTRTSDGRTANTVEFAVTVPGKTSLPPEQTPVAGVSLDRTALSLKKGETAILKADVSPADATDSSVAWRSSDDSIATVADGTVTAIGEGTAIVTVTTTDGGFSATANVTVEAAEPGEPTPTPTPTPTTSPTPTPTPINGTIVVTADQLRAGAGGTATVNAPAGTREVALPAQAAELLSGGTLRIASGALTLDVPAGLIRQLADQLPADERQAGQISLKFDPVSAADAQAIAAKSGQATGFDVQLKGSIYNFVFSIASAGGRTASLSKFDQPMTIRLKADPGLDPKLAGIYYIADDGALEYIGGTYENGEYVAQIRHFSAYAVLQLTKNFADVTNKHWAYNVIQGVVAKQIVKGTGASTFEPGRSVARAEFASMLVQALKLTKTSDVRFADVASGAWYAEAISIAYGAGIVKGKSVNTFDPNGVITREEMVVMTVKAYAILKGGQPAKAGGTPFKDMAKVSAWAADDVLAAAALHLINGRDGGQFAPKGATTRAEAAQVIDNLLRS
ncbi:S-layer homology domain-containing protein [Cohnella sp. REN36]|uniref:S-layer homology domain-containing protein n=2 Tax=Paenibacillaceae TaxID=186822 RepID=UPI001D15112A|nr:S-layer homology domain-containing protein [Cohnella sp. REN36]